MAFKFIVKDEDLPKPTILSITHLISILMWIPALSLIEKLHTSTIIIFLISEFLQIVYIFVFYKKIVRERYTNIKLRTVTISFIVTNIYFGIASIFEWKYGEFLSLTQIVISLFLVFFASIPITIYMRKIDFLFQAKNWFGPIKDFSFPYYKFAAIVPMFFVLLNIWIKSQIYIGTTLAIMVIGMFYTGLGEYYQIKKKDELDRLIKYEASYIIMQFLPGVLIFLFYLEFFFKVKVPWFLCMLVFTMINLLIQTIINRKYE